MKKILTFLVFIVLFLFTIDISASEVKIPISGRENEYITYKDGTYVTLPVEFKYQEKEFRGVWVSNFAGDVPTYTTEAKFKTDMTNVLDILEYYNYNALIFHVRTHNNALYKSTLNPKASFWGRVDFDKFDPLEWLIEETHKRGMEFHAWMNPYRVESSSGNRYCSGAYPKNNPASDTSNLLYGDTVIFNPAKESVKSFLVQTCMEVVRNYDVDAIHFDDYFYVDGIGNSDDSDYYNNNPNGLSKADWRRSQVDEFIRRLSIQIKAYNVKNNKSVQLGIAPGGAYRNGDGKVTYDENGTAITNGSLTSASEHYDNYLYADTKNWVDNEWIDYILPQCYHGMELGNFAALIDWWDAVVKNKKVNLYIGIGFYMEKDHWQREDELKNEIYFMNKHDNVNGFAIYSYSTLKAAYSKKNQLKAKQIAPLYELAWNKKCLPEVIERYEFSTPEPVENLNISINDTGYELSFDNVSSNKFYAIYQSEDGKLDICNLVKVTSGEIVNDKVIIPLEKNDEKEYKISVAALAQNNLLGKEKEILTSDISHKVTFVDEKGNILDIKYTNNSSVSEPNISLNEGEILSYSQSLDNITGNTTITVKILEKKKEVTFEYLDENLNKVIVSSEFDNEIIFPVLKEIEGLKFIEFVLEKENYYVAKYEKVKCNVKFLNFYNEVIENFDIEYGSTIEKYPFTEEIEGYNFVKWDFNETVIKDIVVKPIYEKKKLQVVFKSNLGDIIETKEVLYGDSVDLLDEVDGYNILGFYLNDEKINELDKVEDNLVIIVKLEENKGCATFSVQTILSFFTVLTFAFVLKKKKYL